MSNWCLNPKLATHQGRRRPENEDAVHYAYPTDTQRLAAAGALFVVADGVGGLQAGENASHIAVQMLVDQYYTADGDPAERLQTVIQRINHLIYERFSGESATTFTAAVFQGDEVIIGHVGDSRAYWITADSVQQLTTDHTMVVQKPGGKSKKKLERALGYRERVMIDTHRYPLTAGGYVLLASDGITRYMEPSDLQPMVIGIDPAVSVPAIIERANQSGGVDNSSLALIHVVRPCTDPTTHQQHITDLYARPILIELHPNLGFPAGSPTPIAQPQVAAPPVPPPPPPPPRIPQEPDTAVLRAVGTQPKRRGGAVWIAAVLLIAIIGAWVILTDPFAGADSPTPTELPPTASDSSDNNNTNDDGGQIAPTRTTLEPTSAATDAPPPTQEAPTLPAAVHTEPLTLREGVTVQFDATALTYIRIGETVVAFPLVINTPYQVSDTFTTSDGMTWYRLYDDSTEQEGWIAEDTLPNYQIEP